MVWELIFDEVIKRQLKKVEDHALHSLVKKCFDDVEENGPMAGKLLDNHVRLFEWKMHHPPLRVYYTLLENNQVLFLCFALSSRL